MTKACSAMSKVRRVLEFWSQSSVVRIVYKVIHLEVSTLIISKSLNSLPFDPGNLTCRSFVFRKYLLYNKYYAFLTLYAAFVSSNP